MKLFIVTCMVVYAAADVSHILPKGTDESKAQILEQELDVSPEGDYQFSFQTDNGISTRARGELVSNPGAEGSLLASQGEAGWTAPNGEAVSFQYVANENGYQPQGSHIPTPPPIPEAIVRALEYIRAHPPPPEKN